jgi:hypothetical protein
MTRLFQLAVLGNAVLSVACLTGRIPVLRAEANCRTADAFQNKFSSWISHTVKDSSYHAGQMRTLSGLPHQSTASVSAVTDPSQCAVLAARFAAMTPSRSMLTVPDVVVIAVDSTFYVVSDFSGGPSEPQAKVNADSTLTVDGRDRWMDAMTVNRTTGVAVLWRWVYLPSLDTPYESLIR